METVEIIKAVAASIALIVVVIGVVVSINNH